VGLRLGFSCRCVVGAVEDEVAQLVGGVEPGAVAVTLVRAEDDDRSVGVRDAEGVEGAGADGEAGRDDAIAFEGPDDVGDRFVGR
jgi:hypothetical protein